MASKLESEVEADKAGHTTFGDGEFLVDEAALADLRVVVTGGASGIGEACCRRLAAAGASVVIADKNVELGNALQAQLNRRRVKFIEVDVASWDSQLAMFAEALNFLPGHDLDALITSAGIGSSSDLNITKPSGVSLHQRSVEERQALPRPSTKCLDYCMSIEAFGNAIGSSRKSVVLLGSTSGFRPLNGKIDYSVAKWGVRGYFRNIRQELAQHGIRVNMMAPFWVPTSLTQHHVPALEKQGVRVGRMEDVIDGILRMLLDGQMSGRAVSVTGKGIEDIDDDLAGLDGGEAMRNLVRGGWLSAPKSATLRR
ncbi:unnamed protein product [Cercospora beticola]|nr:unnamed protein product [Cercospora beticola]